jgi:transcriptional regulator with XRE-family HTH domain
MDDVRVGYAIRSVRLRRGLTQAEVAAAASVSPSTVSLIECGGLENATVRVIRRIASCLGMSLPFAPRWRGSDLPKLIDERHACICRDVATRLERDGWLVHPEYAFNWRGERGAIDILAWHPATRSLLIIEVETALPDLQDLLSVWIASGGWRLSSWASAVGGRGRWPRFWSFPTRPGHETPWPTSERCSTRRCRPERSPSSGGSNALRATFAACGFFSTPTLSELGGGGEARSGFGSGFAPAGRRWTRRVSRRAGRARPGSAVAPCPNARDSDRIGIEREVARHRCVGSPAAAATG